MRYQDITRAELTARLAVLLTQPIPTTPRVAMLAEVAAAFDTDADWLSAEIALVLLEQECGQWPGQDPAYIVTAARWQRRARAIVANPVKRHADV